MLDYLYANNHVDAFNALKESAGIEYTPDPSARYTGLLEKKWTSVIRLQKKVSALRAKLHAVLHHRAFISNKRS